MTNIQDTLKERAETHGDFATQATCAAVLLDTMMSTPNWNNLNPVVKHGITMLLMKLSRLGHGDLEHGDHYEDICGYSTLIKEHMEGKQCE